MGPSLANYLRTHRRKSGLSQREVAELLGLYSGQIISRYERLSRMPNLQSVLAFQVLFDVLPHQLFPGLYADVTKLTLARIRSLLKASSEDDAGIGRHQVLQDVVRRVETRPNAYDSRHTLGADGALPLL